MTDYLEQIDCTVEELYREVRETQSETSDPFLKTFIDCLLASADYESFYKVFAVVDMIYHINASHLASLLQTIFMHNRYIYYYHHTIMLKVMVREGRKVKAGNPKRYTDKAESKSEEKTPERRSSSSLNNDNYENQHHGQLANSQSKYVPSNDNNGNSADSKTEGKYSGDFK